MPLVQLTYHSRRLHQSSEEAAKVVADITRTASLSNRRADITGCLAFTEPEFLQILEGEEAVVRGLFRKIARDIRHDRVELVNIRSVRGRSFRAWAMAAVDLCAQSASMRAYSLSPDMRLSTMPPSLALLLLMDVGDRAQRDGRLLGVSVAA
jgi:hypothetical protein